jgi:hypothetical protein
MTHLKCRTSSSRRVCFPDASDGLEVSQTHGAEILNRAVAELTRYHHHSIIRPHDHRRSSLTQHTSPSHRRPPVIMMQWHWQNTPPLSSVHSSHPSHSIAMSDSLPLHLPRLHPLTKSTPPLTSHVIQLPRVYSSSSLLSAASTASPISSASPEAVQPRGGAMCITSSGMSDSTASTPPPRVASSISVIPPNDVVSHGPAVEETKLKPLARSASNLTMAGSEATTSPESARSSTTEDHSSLDTLAQAAMMLTPTQPKKPQISVAVHHSQPRQAERQPSRSHPSTPTGSTNASRFKSKLPPDVSSFNHSTYMVTRRAAADTRRLTTDHDTEDGSGVDRWTAAS